MKRKICFWILATCGEGACLSTHTPQQSGGKKFYRWREGATCRNSTVSSDHDLEVGHWRSDQCRLVLGPVNLQFQGWFVSISSGQFSELWQLPSWLQSGHHTVNFSYLVGVSIYKTAQRLWLRILSIALEKDFAY